MQQFSNIKFDQGKRVDDIINQLHAIQLRANRITPNTVTTDLMRGALLDICSKHPDFKNLAAELSRPSNNHTYEQICNELREHETNNNMSNSKPNALNPRAFNLQDLPDGALAALFASFQGQDKKKEICRNYLNGICKNDSCPRIHPAGKEGSKKRERDNNRNRNRDCWNCGQAGHISRNCTKPRKPKEQANQAESKEDQTAAETSIEEFLQALQQGGASANHLTTAGDTHHLAMSLTPAAAPTARASGEDGSDSDAAELCGASEDEESNDDTTALDDCGIGTQPRETVAVPDALPFALAKEATQQRIVHREFGGAVTEDSTKTTNKRGSEISFGLLDSGASGHFLHAKNVRLSKTSTVRPDDSKVSSAATASKPLKSLGRTDASVQVDDCREMELRNAMLMGPEADLRRRTHQQRIHRGLRRRLSLHPQTPTNYQNNQQDQQPLPNSTQTSQQTDTVR